MKLLIYASQYYNNKQEIKEILNSFHEIEPITALVQGTDKQIYNDTEDWAVQMEIPVTKIKAYPEFYFENSTKNQLKTMIFWTHPTHAVVLGKDTHTEKVTQLLCDANISLIFIKE